MLAAGAAEGDHQVLESALLIVAYAGVDEGHHASQELVDALLLVEIFDHRRVSAGQCFESLFAPGIGQAAAIEDKAATISTVVFRQAAMKREADDPHHQIVGVGGKALQLFGSEHGQYVHRHGAR